MEELVVGRDLSWMDSFPAVHEPEAEYRTRNRKKKYPHKKKKSATPKTVRSARKVTSS